VRCSVQNFAVVFAAVLLVGSAWRECMAVCVAVCDAMRGAMRAVQGGEDL